MSLIPGIRRLFRIDETPRAVEHDVDDELRFHFEMTVKHLVAGGMSEEAARREADRRFGDRASTQARLVALDRSRVAATRRMHWWQDIGQDVRYAVRAVRRKPGFAAAIVLTLGLGIGANATMFGIVDRLLLRPPAYLIDPGRVHRLYFGRTNNGKEFVGGETQYQRFLDITRTATTIDVSAAYAPRHLAVGVGDNARDLGVGGVSASMWSLFDAKPVLGRFFTAAEDAPPNGTKVAVLSYPFWKSEYGSARDVIGRSIRIGPSAYTIIGVAPEGFAAMELETPAVFVPLTAAGDDAYAGVWVECRTSYCLTWVDMYVREKPGVTPEAATADLTRAFQLSYRKQIADNPRATAFEIAKPRVVVASTLAQRGPNQTADSKVALWLLGVAGVVLLIACANVGNLLLGRALRRRREVALRLALGVSRGRLLRSALIESLVFAVLGAIAGLLVTQWGGAVLRNVLMPQVEWSGAISDRRVALFASLLAIAAGLLSAMAPVFDARRVDLAASLKSGARERGARPTRARASLLIAQAALSVVLVIGAGLFVRSIRNVEHIHLGYDADRLLWIEPRLRGIKLDAAAKIALRDALLARAQHAPGVASASLNIGMPFYIEYNTEFFVTGVDSVDRLGEFHQREVSPNFFTTAGTRILAGRRIEEGDRPLAPRVVVVSEAMAKALWPNQNAIGKCMRIGADTMPCTTVVGIAENIKQASFGDDPSLTYYLPFDQAELTLEGMAIQSHNAGNAALGGLLVRTRGNAHDEIDAVRRFVQQAMPGSGYLAAITMDDILAPQRRSWSLGATMFAVFGALALTLAGIGLYSVIAFSVTERTSEIGVRIALGAQPADVVVLVVRQAVSVVLAGVAIGLGIALVSGRWVAPLLFHVSPHDPLVLAAVTGILLLVSVLASWIPALRAAGVDPNVALRAE